MSDEATENVPAPLPPVYVFGIRRRQDATPWFVAYTDKTLAWNQPYRATCVAEVHLERAEAGNLSLPPVRPYRQLMKAAASQEGVDSLELITGLQKKVSDQAREISRLHTQLGHHQKQGTEPSAREAFDAFVKRYGLARETVVALAQHIPTYVDLQAAQTQTPQTATQRVGYSDESETGPDSV